MKWQQAVEIVESHSSPETELLKASRVLAALVKTLLHRKKRMVTVGVVTHSLEDWSRLSGVGVSAIYNRLAAGWPEDQAVTQPHQTNGSKFNGKTLDQHAKDSGLSRDCIYARLQRGWTIEEAVTNPKQPKRNNKGN